MQYSLAPLALASLALAANPAPITQQNPIGTVYRADMPQINSSSIQGYAAAQANDNGTGLVWDINFSNLPKTGGPFAYHVHVDPVPADGNCTGAGAHLDPENRGEKPPCDLSQGAKSCQVGDLAGKHGKITTDPFQVFYLDLYTGSTPGSASFMGNRSIVIHDASLNRIACANITMAAFAAGPSGQSGSAPSSTSSASSASATSSGSPTAAAHQNAATTTSSPAQGAATARDISSAAGYALGAAMVVAAFL